MSPAAGVPMQADPGPAGRPAPDGAPILSLRDVSVAFKGLRALDGVTFDVPTGGVTAVIGPNGAGKTTLFNCISGIYRSAGDILLGGEPLGRTPPHARAAAGIARTFQTPVLIEDDTVLANVMLGAFRGERSGLLGHMLLSSRSRAEEATAREQAADALDMVGLLHLAGADAADLPHGLRRRIEVARALMSRPRLLLLDEPAAGISHNDAAAFADLLGTVAERSGATLLLVEHSVALVMRIARRIAVLDFGRLIAEGEPAAVRRDPRVMAAYLGTEDQ
jgi:branched-chain amino acid transport system ATP-binding protein